MLEPVKPAEFALLLRGRLIRGRAAPSAAPRALDAIETAELGVSDEAAALSGKSRRRRGGGQIKALEGMLRR